MRKIFLYLYVLFIMPVHYTASSASTKTALENFAKEIKKNNTWLYKKEFNSISNEDLVKSYSLISSDIPEDLVKGQPTTDHKMIARCYIDNDTEGVSLWHSLERGRDLLDKILSSETNNGDIGAIFESLNNECKKMFDNVGCFTDEELKKHIKLQKKKLFTHIKKHIRLIPKPLKDEDITGLMKEGDNSVFIFFDPSKSLKEEKNFLLTTALNKNNIQYIQEEDSFEGPRVAVYSNLPKLDHEKLLGSAILGNADYRLIAVRNYLGECGMYLTDTVKIPFLIEKSNNDKLIRFRISTIYPYDPMVFNLEKNKWIEPFSYKASMSLMEATTNKVLNLLLRYIENKDDWITNYLHNIPLKDSCHLADLPRYVVSDAIKYIGGLLNNDEIEQFDSVKNDILEYKEQYDKLEKDIASFMAESNHTIESLSSLNTKKETLKKISLECNKCLLSLEKLSKAQKKMQDEIQALMSSLLEVDEKIGHEFQESSRALEYVLCGNSSQLKSYTDSIFDLSNKVINLTESINNIKTPPVTRSLDNTVAENPPPMPDKKSSNKNKKNNKPEDGSKEGIDKDAQKYKENFTALLGDILKIQQNTNKYSITDKELGEYEEKIKSLKKQYEKLSAKADVTRPYIIERSFDQLQTLINNKNNKTTPTLNNTVAENPPPVPNKKANNKNKKNNKPGDGSKRIIGKNDILVNANAQQIQKQQETLTANYREKYKKIHANINIIKAEAENYLKSDDYFLGDQKENEKKAQQLRDSLKSDKKILTNLEIMYSQIEDKRFIKDPNPIRETVKKVENNIYTICPPKLKSQ